MTKEEKQLLLKDLCARLPYGNTEIKVTELTNDMMGEVFVGKHICSTIDIEDFILGKYIIRPYLRPLSSMTEEEIKEFHGAGMLYNPQNDTWVLSVFTSEAYDWLNEHHFDYRGLIPMGLALEATEEVYELKH